MISFSLVSCVKCSLKMNILQRKKSEMSHRSFSRRTNCNTTNTTNPPTLEKKRMKKNTTPFQTDVHFLKRKFLSFKWFLCLYTILIFLSWSKVCVCVYECDPSINPEPYNREIFFVSQHPRVRPVDKSV